MRDPNPHLLAADPNGAAIILLFGAYRALADDDGSINGGDAVDLLNQFFTDHGLDLDEPHTCEGCEDPACLIVEPKDGYEWPDEYERTGYCYPHLKTSDVVEKLTAAGLPFQVTVPALRGLIASAHKTIERAQSS
ncbi:hypothetical protein AB0M43_36215 [Longispora sp. NPDC051575]|uniref:hypothetical protein n=1 Tax=Longispora sp. NPDC051575 TaxID=3154943 RepID=UPI003416F5F5